MSEESIKNPPGSGYAYVLTLINSHRLPYVNCVGNCLRRSSIFVYRNVVNLYISYTLNMWPIDLNTNFTLVNSLVGAVRLTKNDDREECGYSGYCTEFNAGSQFSLLDGSFGKIVLIFGVDNS